MKNYPGGVCVCLCVCEREGDHCRTKEIFVNKNSVGVFVNLLDLLDDSIHELEGKYIKNSKPKHKERENKID